MALSCIVFDIKKSRFFHTPSAFDARVRESRRYIAIRFGEEKLQWYILYMVKKFDDMILRLEQIVD